MITAAEWALAQGKPQLRAELGLSLGQGPFSGSNHDRISLSLVNHYLNYKESRRISQHLFFKKRSGFGQRYQGLRPCSPSEVTM